MYRSKSEVSLYMEIYLSVNLYSTHWNTCIFVDDPLQDDPNIETDSLTEMTVNINEPKPDSVYLKR